MNKTIDDITISGINDNYSLTNAKNNSHIYINLKNDTISYCDPFGNNMLNHSCTMRLNFEVFKITELGQIINRDNGTVIAYLSGEDVKELAERTFYEYEQTRVFDFINFRFNVDL